MALGSIVVDLLLRSGSFDSDTKAAEKRLKKMAQTAKAAGVVIGTALVAAFAASAVAIRSSIKSMDAMSKAALRAGTSTEEFSKLSYAGSLADVSMEDLTKTLGKLGKAQADAMDEVSTQSDIFKALDIDIKNTDGTLRKSIDVLYDFADAYLAMGGSQTAQAAGMELFGKSFQKVIPLIKDGSQGLRDAGDDLERFGGVLSGQAGRDAEAFNDNITRLTKQVSIFWQLVASNLLPDLLKLSDRFVQVATKADLAATAADGVRDSFKALGELKDVGSAIFTFLQSVKDYLSGLERQAVGVTRLISGISLVNGSWDEDLRKIKEGTAMMDAAAEGRKYNKDLGYQFQGVTSGLAKPPTPVIMAGGEDPNGFFKRSRREVELAGEKLDLENRLAAAFENKTEKSTKAGKAAVAAISEEQKALEALQASYTSQMESMEREIALYGDLSRVAATRYEIERDGLEAIDPLRAKALQEQAEWLDFLDEQAVLEGVWAEGRQDAINRQIEGWSNASDEMSAYADQAARNMQDAFADFLFDPFEGGMKGMLKSFGEILRRMAAEAAAAKIFDSLGKTGQANGGTWWGSLLSAFAGAGGKAAGGYIAGPGTGKSDSIPTYLSNGEYVIQADAVNRYGKQFFDGLNAKRFASGGFVGGPVPGVAGGRGEVNVNIYNAPEGASVDKRNNSKGGMDIDVIFKSIESGIAGNVAAGASPINGALQGRYGLRPAV